MATLSPSDDIRYGLARQETHARPLALECGEALSPVDFAYET